MMFCPPPIIHTHTHTHTHLLSVCRQLDSFIKYCTDADGLDENPLYLFEPDFLQKHPKLAPLAKDYAVPQAFSEDLFSLLGEEHRPDYKWMLVGGRRCVSFQ